MKIIKEYIQQQQKLFEDHIFFHHLEKIKSIEEFLAISADLAFWVMTFQDILRLNEARVQDHQLNRVARHHRLEDRNHEQWFLQDIAHLQDEKSYDIRKLFSKENIFIRDSVYVIISEVITLKSDILRVILLLILESSGHIFFERTAAFVESMGFSKKLKYFSAYHLEIEKAHAMFETEMERELDIIELTQLEKNAAKALTDKTYNAFNAIFDGLVLKLTGKEEEPIHADLYENADAVVSQLA